MVVEEQGQRNTNDTSETRDQVNKAKQSYWPIVLALSLTLALVGVILMSHPIVFWVGVAFVIVSLIGWGIERR